MKNDIDAGKQGLDRGGVTNVSAVKLDRASNLVEVFLPACQQRIDDDHAFDADFIEERPDQGRTDEAGAASNQDVAHALFYAVRHDATINFRMAWRKHDEVGPVDEVSPA